MPTITIKNLEKEAMDWLQTPTDADLDVIREHMAEFVDWLDKQPEDAKQTNFWQWYEKGESHGNQN